MQDFRNLKVWQRAHSLTLDVHRITADFPKNEQFGVTSQLRRACASIAANLAERCARASDADFARFVNMALGSASETDYHLLLARDFKYLDEAIYQSLFAQISEVKRMLNSFERTLRSSAQPGWLTANS
jgi:four helix bundle protein